jgi:hypothetical protein
VGNRRLAVLAWHGDFEDTKVVLGHGRRIAVPAVEVANEVSSQGIRGPLAVYDVAVGLDNEAKLLVTLKTLLATLLPLAHVRSLPARTSPDRLRSHRSS